MNIKKAKNIIQLEPIIDRITELGLINKFELRMQNINSFQRYLFNQCDNGLYPRIIGQLRDHYYFVYLGEANFGTTTYYNLYNIFMMFNKYTNEFENLLATRNIKFTDNKIYFSIIYLFNIQQKYFEYIYASESNSTFYLNPIYPLTYSDGLVILDH